MDISKLTVKNYLYEGQFKIWGEDSGILVRVEDGTPDNDLTREKVLAVMEKITAVLNEKRSVIEQALIDDDMVATAEDWASSGEEDYDEGDEDHEDDDNRKECYILEDGSKVYLPITEEDFKASLTSSGGVLAYVNENFEYKDFDFFINCEPDYFACHSILVSVDADGSVKVGGLAG